MSDPMLDGITAYTMDVECMSYCYGGSPRLEQDKYPDDNFVVKWSDHFRDGLAQGQRDERERIRTGVTGLPLDNSGRVDYADLLAVIDGGEA